MGFRITMRERAGGRALIEATDTDGIDTAVRDQTISILREHPEITAVYSIGGGNKASWMHSISLAGNAGSSSLTIWTGTTCRSSRIGRSPRCSTTTCAMTCAAPVR